jgi:hypothetical protein
VLTITLLPEVKILVHSAIRLANFIRIDYTHGLSRHIKEEELLDFELVDLIAGKIASGEKALKLSPSETIHLYILLDVYAKAFLADVSTHMQQNFQQKPLSDAEFADLRSRHLNLAERVLALVAAQLTGNKEFARVQEALNVITQEIL